MGAFIAFLDMSLGVTGPAAGAGAVALSAIVAVLMIANLPHAASPMNQAR
jgi:hypothetical protein